MWQRRDYNFNGVGSPYRDKAVRKVRNQDGMRSRFFFKAMIFFRRRIDIEVHFQFHFKIVANVVLGVVLVSNRSECRLRRGGWA